MVGTLWNISIRIERPRAGRDEDGGRRMIGREEDDEDDEEDEEDEVRLEVS